MLKLAWRLLFQKLKRFLLKIGTVLTNFVEKFAFVFLLTTFTIHTNPKATMNIFISNISFKVREQTLSELFSQFGEVTSVRIIKDKESRRSKGYGFVEMANDAEATAAINALNGTEHYERNIVVAEAKGKKEPAQESSQE